MGYGGMSAALTAKMSGGKKKPKFMDDTSGTSGGDTGDDSVDPSGKEEADDMGLSAEVVNSSPEDEMGIARGTKETSDTGDSEPDIGDEGEGKEMGSYSAVEDDAASELASIAGVPEDKKEAFKSALSDYVAACVQKHMK